MKNALLLLCAAFFALGTFAQSPQAIPYQAVVRDTTGTPIPNQHMQTRFTVHDSIATGAVVYQETDTFTTTSLGLFTVNVGRGTVVSGVFSAINWASNPMFLQVEIDPTGGTSFVNMGSAQMMSVPYALYAGASATPVPSGIVLLGKFIGANMNSQGTYTLQLTGMSGTFYPGEWIDGPAVGQVASLSDTTLVLANAYGSFSNLPPLSSGLGGLRLAPRGRMISGQYGLLTYTSLLDTFQGGEQVTDLANLSTLNILTDNGLDTMQIQNPGADFSPGDTILGQSSGATAVVATFAAPGAAIIASSSFSGGDQSFTLTGGSTMLATYVLFTNASTSLTTAADPEIWTGGGRTGNAIFIPAEQNEKQAINSYQTIGALQSAYLQSQYPPVSILSRLVNSSNTISGNSQYLSTFGGGTVYFSLGTAQGAAATTDIYVYGFILH